MATIETYLTARAAAREVEVGRPHPTIECAVTRARVAIKTGLGGTTPAPPDLNALITADGDTLITADGDTLVWI